MDNQRVSSPLTKLLDAEFGFAQLSKGFQARTFRESLLTTVGIHSRKCAWMGHSQFDLFTATFDGHLRGFQDFHDTKAADPVRDRATT